MPADAPAGRCEHLDQIVVHVARLDARNAEAHGIFPFFMQVSRLFEEHPQKIGKAGRLPRLLVTPTVGSEVYPVRTISFTPALASARHWRTTSRGSTLVAFPRATCTTQ